MRWEGRRRASCVTDFAQGSPPREEKARRQQTSSLPSQSRFPLAGRFQLGPGWIFVSCVTSSNQAGGAAGAARVYRAPQTQTISKEEVGSRSDAMRARRVCVRGSCHMGRRRSARLRAFANRSSIRVDARTTSRLPAFGVTIEQEQITIFRMRPQRH